MMPWERDIYIAMLVQYLEQEEQKLKERQRRYYAVKRQRKGYYY